MSRQKNGIVMGPSKSLAHMELWCWDGVFEFASFKAREPGLHTTQCALPGMELPLKRRRNLPGYLIWRKFSELNSSKSQQPPNGLTAGVMRTPATEGRA